MEIKNRLAAKRYLLLVLFGCAAIIGLIHGFISGKEFIKKNKVRQYHRPLVLPGRYIAAGGEKYIKKWDVSEYNVEN
jgi:hydrogenase/urease accessory protein HupE